MSSFSQDGRTGEDPLVISGVISYNGPYRLGSVSLFNTDFVMSFIHKKNREGLGFFESGFKLLQDLGECRIFHGPGSQPCRFELAHPT